MAGPDQPSGSGNTAQRRRERLAAELRANLVKRKKQAQAQARTARDGDGGDGRPDKS